MEEKKMLELNKTEHHAIQACLVAVLDNWDLFNNEYIDPNIMDPEDVRKGINRLIDKLHDLV